MGRRALEARVTRQRLARRREHGERGAATVEFALVSVPALILALGLIQFGWYFYVAETASGAASTVSRRLAVGDCWVNADDAKDFALEAAPQVTAVTKTPITIDATTPRGTEIVVEVTATANILDFLPMPDGGVVTRTVTTRLEDTESSGSC